ncbi:tryptophan--tRNA ligase [Patescibacteria group bacterium]
MKKRIFSGIQPTGSLHIGNYLGAIKNWTELQNKYDSIFCIVDLHALTVYQNPKILRKNILETAAVFLAAGIDPKKSVIFIQSHIKEHAELSWILNTVVRISELERMTQFKEKSQQHKENINVGLFNYPVLMAADILLYNTSIVPVGEDQTQHVELARTLAQRFNKTYGKTFVIPESLIKKEQSRIKGLDNPAKKMAKSSENLNNYIALYDSPELIHDKIKRAVTDSGSEIKYSQDKPAISNLMTIYRGFSNMPFEQIEEKYKNKNYSDFKNDLAKVIINNLKPFQDRLKTIKSKPDYIEKILKKGAKDAEKIAKKTMVNVKKKIGLV